MRQKIRKRYKALLLAAIMAVSSMNITVVFAADNNLVTEAREEVKVSSKQTRRLELPEKGAEEMTLSQDYKYDTNNSTSATFSFTPQESGEYVFRVTSSYMWVGLSLYDSEREQIDSTISLQYIRHYLEKGKIYYYRCSTDPTGDEADSKVAVRLEKVPEIESLTLDMRSTKTEFLAGLDACYIPQAILKVKYAGIEEETQLNYGKGYDSDDTLRDFYGNQFQCYFTNQLDKDSERYKSGNTLDSGVYHVVFYCNGKEMQMDNDSTITVKQPENLPVLTVGKNNVNSPMSGYTWYSFSVSNTGYYVFSPFSQIRVWEKTNSGLEEVEGTIEGDYGKKEGDFKFEQGKEYFVGLNGGIITMIDFGNFWAQGIKTEYSLRIVPREAITTVDEVRRDMWNISDEIEGDLTPEQKIAINDMVKRMLVFDSKEIFAVEYVRGVVEDLENLALQANDTLDETIIEDTAQSGTTNIAGAALTAAKVGSEEGQKLAAKVQIQKSQKQYPELGSNTVAFNLKMSVVDKNHSNAVIQENVQPAMPITLQLPIPEQYQGGKFDVFFGKEDSSYSEAEWYYTDNQHTQVKVTVPVASEVVFVSDSCIGEHQLDENAWKITKQPTCGEDGEKSNTCKVCGTVVKQSIPATGKHSFGEWKTIKAATAKAEGVQERSCTVCGKKETQNIARTSENSTPALNVPTNKVLPLKVKQGFQIKVTDLAKDDSIVSWKVDNEKVLSVSSNGTIKGKKPGTATVTVQLKSGAGISVKVKVQKKDVTTSAIKVLNVATGKKLPKTVNLKVKGKMNLSVVITPVTSKQKVKYTSSNKKIVTVSGKGVVKAKKKGSAVITVQSGKKKVKMKVKVK